VDSITLESNLPVENTRARKVTLFLTYSLIDEFDFFGLMTTAMQTEERAVNLAAAKQMGLLHSFLHQYNYRGRKLEILLTRLLFCFFAEDSGLFKIRQFEDLTKNYPTTFFDVLCRLFVILNTPYDKRATLPELLEIKQDKALYNTLSDFPYVNGNLFAEKITDYPFKFSKNLQGNILEAARLNWFVISPAIFGTLFQSVMTDTDRRTKGAHYTSQENILRALEPLFLDDLHVELDAILDEYDTDPTHKIRNKKLKILHQRICNLRFLDPACGCGNFLIVAYTQLRFLEQQIFEHLVQHLEGSKHTEYFEKMPRVSIHSFYGIEYDEAAAHIGRLALLLAKHQCDSRLYETTKADFLALPLDRMPPIKNANALTTTWEAGETVYDYIIGNPPFVGKQLQNSEQKADMAKVFAAVQGAGVLDYVTAWYLKAATYMQKHPKTETVFVSTNSVAQGEQVGVLWKTLFTDYNIQINFAHQTFKWNNEDDGVAAVHCVIIGFAQLAKAQKTIFEYEDITKPPKRRTVENINPYLIAGNNSWVEARKKPLCAVPEMGYGSKPTDGGHLLLTKEEKDDLVKYEPKAALYIRKMLGSDEFINNIERYCLWLVDIDPAELQKMPLVKKRVEAVRKMRLSSTKAATVKLADFPTTFAEPRQPKTDYLIIPRVSSENRKYIPIGYISKKVIVNDAVFALQSDDIFLFGILTSKMHNVWTAYTCGRLESRLRYSNTIVYNNYPFPMQASFALRKKVEEAAQGVLDTRACYPNASLAALYGASTMPPDLTKAHAALDKAVDMCYRKEAFGSDTERIEYLFAAYEALLV
jgi:N-6 DNA Methylase